MNPVHLPLNYVRSDVHIETIKGTAGDYDGQVACNCTILKGRVKRGPGKGQPTFRVRNYFDLEALRSNPLAVVHVTEEGLDTLHGCVESLKQKPLTDEEFVSFLKGDMLNAKLIATDKNGNEVDLTNLDPLPLVDQPTLKSVEDFSEAHKFTNIHGDSGVVGEGDGE